MQQSQPPQQQPQRRGKSIDQIYQQLAYKVVNNTNQRDGESLANREIMQVSQTLFKRIMKFSTKEQRESGLAVELMTPLEYVKLHEMRKKFMREHKIIVQEIQKDIVFQAKPQNFDSLLFFKQKHELDQDQDQ